MKGERCERQARSGAPSVHTDERVEFTESPHSQLGSNHVLCPVTTGGRRPVAGI